MDTLYTWHRWAELTPDRLYAFLKLRSDIFVVEQNCVFPEMDGIDPLCEHLSASSPDGQLMAYLRLVPPGVKRPHSESPAAAGPAVGRVVVASQWRGTGLGRQLMVRALEYCGEHYPGQPVALSGQQHLERFYASLGFVTQSPPYLEDGIWHVDMSRHA
ncbi:MAG: family N-acetyltransferase [Hydrocarboniphaga sp.]|uniref:GNAT family N-acetyltransferase n=1 Tax=Hydrocarboniphaga sp. TaxID=2033016 RepID=UPI00263A2DF5|nr:GNAT family N-acetyltransferase [Hydrocarboniphaga sp.]MDB5967896.1 family N-acetyltransferase [Hydrocarboniphaga sp.]